MASSAAGTRGPLWDAGGVCYHGDGAGPRADELQSEGSAHTGTQVQGQYLSLLEVALVLILGCFSLRKTKR